MDTQYNMVIQKAPRPFYNGVFCMATPFQTFRASSRECAAFQSLQKHIVTFGVTFPFARPKQKSFQCPFLHIEYYMLMLFKYIVNPVDSYTLLSKCSHKARRVRVLYYQCMRLLLQLLGISSDIEPNMMRRNSITRGR